MRRPAAALILLALAAVRADDLDRLTVGPQPDGRVVVPTNQILQPAGGQVPFPGRPVDLVPVEDGRTLAVKNTAALTFIDLATGTVRQTLTLPSRGQDRTGFSVVGLAARGDRVFAGDGPGQVHVARRRPDGRYAWDTPVAVRRPADGKAADVAGIAVLDDDRLAVASTRGNSVQVVDVTAGQVEQVIPVGVAPFMVLPVGPDKWYVSNWGGDPPGPNDPRRNTAGT